MVGLGPRVWECLAMGPRPRAARVKAPRRTLASDDRVVTVTSHWMDGEFHAPRQQEWGCASPRRGSGDLWPPRRARNPKDGWHQGRLSRICLIRSSSHTAAKTPMAFRARSNITQAILSPPYAVASRASQNMIARRGGSPRLSPQWGRGVSSYPQKERSRSPYYRRRQKS